MNLFQSLKGANTEIVTKLFKAMLLLNNVNSNFFIMHI